MANAFQELPWLQILESLCRVSLWVSKRFALKSFRMAAATVSYVISSITSSLSRQMADVKMEGILYKNSTSWDRS